MADPLSIAASIAGLVALADTLFRSVVRFQREVRGASQDIANIATELRDLSGVLHSLSLLASALETGREEATFRLHHVNSCRQCILDIQSKLSKELDSLNAPKTTKSIVRRLLWPYTTRETQSILDDISRHKSTMTLALTADSMKAMMKCLSNHTELSQEVSEIRESIKQAKEIATNIAMDERRQNVLSFFLTVNPQKNLDVTLRLRHPLTGLWLTDSDAFHQWMHSPSAKLWLSGIPGAGKTVLAGLITQEVLQHVASSDNHGACFFLCDYKDPTSHLLANILSSLASQLARQNNDAFETLQNYYEYLHPSLGMPRQPDEEKLKEMFLEMVTAFNHVYIVIDGLDECGTDPSVTMGLHSLVSTSDLVSMAILSRDELHIRERLEDTFEHIEIAARSGDIRLYVAAELELRIKEKRLRIHNAGLKDQIIERLVNGAKGMFRWASCQVDYLCEMPTDREIRDALGKLPPTLPASYERILRRKTDPRSVQIIRTTLRLLCLARPFLTIEELCDVVSLPEDVSRIEPEDIVQEDVIASLCGSLIRKTEALRQPIFELAHFTVKEFIQSGCLRGTDLEVYVIDSAEGNEYVAALSLRFLSLDNFNETRMCSPKELFDATDEVAQWHPFHTYASINWLYWSSTLPRFPSSEPHRRFLGPSHPVPPPPPPPGWRPDSKSNSTSESNAGNDAESDSDYSCDPDSETLHGISDRHYRRAIPPEAVVDQIPYVTPGASDLAIRFFNQKKSPAFTLWCAQFTRIYSNHNHRWVQKGKTSEDLFEIMSTLLHSSFTPLHMASALNLPSIVESLLQKGADSQSECGFGSAFQCAVMGSLCWANPDEDALFWADSKYHGEFIRTISALNKYGLINTNLVDRQGRTLSVFDAVLIRFGKDHKIALKLLVSLAEMSSIFRPTSVFLERFKEWTSDNRVLWLPQTPRYLRKLMEVTGRLTIGADLTSHLKEIVEAILEKHESYAGELAIATHRSISDRDYFKELMMGLERDDSVLLNRLSSDSRIWDLHKGHKFGASALHVAAYYGSTKVVQQLLGLGFNVSGRDQHGKSPLHYCCRPFRQQGTLNPKQSIKSAVALLEAGASDMVADDDGNTIWHLAASAGWERLISYLLQRDAGAEGSMIGRTSMNGDGFSPVGLALLRRRIQVAILLLPRYSACLDSEGHSVHPYRVAAEVGSEELVQALSEAGVPIYPRDGSSLKMGTPLHFLECGSSLNCVRCLKALTPKACGEIFRGMTPFETLIFRSLEPRGQPNLDKTVLVELLPAKFKQDAEKRRQLWKSLCQKLTTNAGPRAAYVDYSIIGSIATILEIWFDYNFISLSEGDEEPLTDFFHALKKMIYSQLPPIPTPRLQQVILNQLLNQENVPDYHTLRVPEWALVLLELSVVMHWDKIVAEILRRKVSVHGRSTVRDTSQWPRSAIETACATAPPCPRGIFEQLLDHSERHRMNELHPFSGFGLIHIFVSTWDQYVPAELRERLGMLLKKGVTVNLRDNKWSAPAILRCRGDTAKLLLDHGADPRLEDKYGFNSMFRFALNSDISNLTTLKDRFETIDWNKTFSLDTLGNLEIWTQKTGPCNILHVACLKGSLELAQFLLENTPCNNFNAATERGYTCSHFAASALDGGKVLEHLQARGADLNARSLRGESPLHIAVRFRRRCNVQTFLQLGADPTAVDNTGYTPAARAFVLGFSEISDIFGGHWVSSNPKGSGPFIIENTDTTLLPALYRSIIEEDFQACQTLWSMGCPLNKPIRSCGRCTALDLAVTRGWKGSKSKEIMLWLLHNSGTAWTEICPEHNGSSDNNEDDEEFIGIIQYVIQDDEFNDVLQAFLNQYLPFWPEWLADTEDSAAYLALKNNNLEGLRILLDWVDRHSKGEDRCLKSVHPAVPTLDSMFNSERQAPLLCFAISWSDLDLIELLVEYGANVDIRGEDGQSPLLIAAAYELHTEAEFLLDHGANPNVRDNESDTPLILAVCNGDKAMIELLVSRGADLSVRDWLGASLLTHCSTRDLFQYLLELGVNPSTKNFVGTSEIHNALGRYDLGMFMLQKSLIQTHNLEEKLDLSHFGDHMRIALLLQLLPKMIRVLGKDNVKSMVPTELTKGISPLCDAARRGQLKFLGTLLDLGAEIEFQGHPLGTALMVASIHGELDCVRVLVRRGAAIYYQTQDSNYPSRSALANAEQYPEIRRWILVERYTEQAKIAYHPFQSIDADGNAVRPWSGIRQVQYPLVGARARSPFESSFQFLCRLSRIRRSMRRTVVQYDTLWE